MLDENTTEVISDAPIADVPSADGSPAINQDVTPATTQPEPQESEAPFQVPETDDDLKGQENNPHVKAVIQMRKELRSRDQSLSTLKPLEPYAPLKEYGDAASLTTKLEMLKGLNAPVVENGQAVLDPQTGYPQTTTRPFLEQLSPQMRYKLINEAVSMQGQSGEPIIREILRGYKLDPERLADYQNLGSNYQTESGVVTAEELANIPKNFHEAYKRLLPIVREEFPYLDAADQQKALDESQAVIDSKQFQAQQAEAHERAKVQQAQDQRRQFDEKVQSEYSTFWKNGYTSLAQNLAAEGIVFSSDPATNTFLTNAVTSLMHAAVDPHSRFMAEDAFKAIGVQLDPSTFTMIQTLESKTQERIYYEQQGDNWNAENAKGEENRIVQNLLAKFSPLLLKGSKAVLGSRNGDLPSAARPNIGGGNGLIPPDKTPFGLQPNERPGDMSATRRNFEWAYSK